MSRSPYSYGRCGKQRGKKGVYEYKHTGRGMRTRDDELHSVGLIMDEFFFPLFDTSYLGVCAR